MKKAIILHGQPSKEEYYAKDMPSMSNAHWLPWLQGQLLKKDVAAATSEVPLAFSPKWETWVKEVERYEIGPETILVGHSTGAGFWVKYLSLNKHIKVDKVILVAPWLDPDGDETPGFFNDLEIDSKFIDRTEGTIIFNADNDMGNVLKSVAMIRQTVKDIGYREFHGYGHFTKKSMGTVEFPELLEECLKGNT